MPPHTAEIMRASANGSSSRVVGPGGAERLAEVRDHVPDAATARDGHAIPPPFAVMGQGIAGTLEDVGRDVRVRELRLLHEQDVGPGALEPPRDLLEPGLQRVHVPGSYPHGV
jgi:hypothetical protein